MTSVQGCGSQQVNFEAQINEMDIDKVNPHVAHHVESAQASLQDRVADLQQQIANSNDPVEINNLKNEIMKLEQAFSEFSATVHQLSSQPTGGFHGALSSVVSNMLDAPELREAVAEFRNTINESYQEFGTASMPPSDFCGTMAEPREPLRLENFGFFGRLAAAVAQRMEEVLDRLGIALNPPMADPRKEIGASEEASSADKSAAVDKSAEAESTSSTAETSGTSEAAAAESTEKSTISSGGVDTGDPKAMIELYNRDPEAFYDTLMEMDDPKDRMMMMQIVQNELQQLNQMFSMMSNMSQSMHDTSKAVINNLRV